MSINQKITFPIYAKNGRLEKDGSINGVHLRKIWKQCQREAIEYIREKIKSDPKWQSLSKVKE